MNFFSKAQGQLDKLLNRFLFFLRYPYSRPNIVLGLKFMKLPLIFPFSRGGKIMVINGSGKNPNIQIGPNVWFGDGVELNTSGVDKIIIHEGVTLQDRCKLIGNVTVFRGAILAPNVFVSSGNHRAFDTPYLTIREQDAIPTTQHDKPIENIIEEDCWLGINCFIKQGVYIGRGCVVGANSVITKDLKPYSVVVGNSREIKKRLMFSPSHVLEVSNPTHAPYFYRGFCKRKQFWEEDNLTIFKSGNYDHLTMELEKPGIGVLTLLANSGESYTAKLNGQEKVFKMLPKMSDGPTTNNVPKCLGDYKVISACFSGNVEPKVKALEFVL